MILQHLCPSLGGLLLPVFKPAFGIIPKHLQPLAIGQSQVYQRFDTSRVSDFASIMPQQDIVGFVGVDNGVPPTSIAVADLSASRTEPLGFFHGDLRKDVECAEQHGITILGIAT